MIVRLLLGVAFSRSKEHRWRLGAVTVSSFLAGLLVLTALGVMHLVSETSSRGEARVGLLAQTKSDSDVFVLPTGDSWRGNGIEKVWWSPADPNTQPQVAAGLPPRISPGTSLVSPALDQLISDNPELAKRYPNRRVLGWSAIADSNELLAFVRLPESIASSGTRTSTTIADRSEQSDTEQSGDADFVRLSRLGSVSRAPEVPDLPLFAGLLILLLTPATVVAVAGLGTNSRVRIARFDLLVRLGVKRPTLARFAIFEGFICSVPGFLAAGVAYTFAAQQLSSLPFTGRLLAPGDLVVPAWQVATALAIFAAFAGAFATSFRTMRTSPELASMSDEPRLKLWYLLPTAGSACLYYIAAQNVVAEIYTLYPATLLALAGTPLVALFVVRTCGRWFLESSISTVHIVGGSMAHFPRRVARSVLGLSLMVATGIALAGWGSAVLRTETPPVAQHGFSFAEINPAFASDANSLVRSVIDAPVTVMALRIPGLDGPSRPEGMSEPIVLSSTCEQMQRLEQDFDCRLSELSGDLKERLSNTLSAAYPIQIESLSWEPLGNDVRPGDVVAAVGSQTVEDLDATVREWAQVTAPGSQVITNYNQRQLPNPLIYWILAGVIASIVAVSLSFVAGFVDRQLGDRADRNQLVSVGVRQRTVMALDGLGLALPYAATMLVAIPVGLFCCFRFLGHDDPFPAMLVSAIVAGCAAVGILVSAFAIALGQRTTFRVRD